MLEIVRGRPWSVDHTVLDTEDGPESDLSSYSATGGGVVVCQIRERNGVRNPRSGTFEYAVIASPQVTLSGDTFSRLRLNLPYRADTLKLREGVYMLDVVGIDSTGNVEQLLSPEPVSVVERPTGLDFVYDEPVREVPDFVQLFQDALTAN